MSRNATIEEHAYSLCSQLKIPAKDLKSRNLVRKWMTAVHEDATTTGRHWLIWNHERKMWWKRSRFGYTADINEAGRFTLNEAEGLTVDGNIHLGTKGRPEDSIVRDN